MTGSACFEAKVGSQEAEKKLLELRASNQGLVLQLVTVERVPLSSVVRMIAAQTVRAMETDSLLASKPEMDLLLRIAGTRQIAEAMGKSGYKVAGKKMLVAIGPERALEKLRSNLTRSGEYTEIEGAEIDDEGLRMVEAAALLGSRT